MAALLLLLAGCLSEVGGPTAVLSSATISGAAPLDVGFDLSFSTGATQGGTTFELDFGDGSSPVSGTEFGIILHHTYESGGAYEASLTVVDESGRSDTDELAITVDETGPEVGIEVGDTAPDFTGHLTTGGEVTLSDYRGSVVLLEFWGAWCPPCRNSMPHLDNLLATYADQGLVAITISTDVTEQAAVDFLTENGYTRFLSVWEAGGKNGNPIDATYDVTSYPTTFVLDRQGVIRWVIHPLNLTGDMIESLL